MLFAVVALLAMPPAALAYSAPTKWDDLSKTGYRPTDGIASFTYAYNNLSFDNVSIASGADTWEFSNNRLYRKQKVTSTGKQAVKPVTVHCEKSTKTVDGQLLDMEVLFTPSVYVCANANAWEGGDRLSIAWFSHSGNAGKVTGIGCEARLESPSDSSVQNKASALVRTTVQVRFYKQDGTIYSPSGRCAYYRFDDLDVSTRGYVNNVYKSSFTDFSAIGDGKGYNEGVQFLGGVQSINVQKVNRLIVSDSYSKYVAAKAGDGGSIDSPTNAVAVRADASGFSFLWQGCYCCGTGILGPGNYVQYRLVVKKASSDSSFACSRTGAVYGVYSDKACTKLLHSATCDADGMAYVPQDGRVLVYDTTYYLKETKAPPGYALDTTVYPFDGKSSYSYVKKGAATYEDLTVNVKDDPLRYKVATSVVNGSIDPTTTGLNWGTDKTVGYAPRDGYILKSVTVDGNEVSIEDFSASYAFTDIKADHTVDVVYEPAPVPFSFTKVDATSDAPLAGASFELYACRDASHTHAADHSETATGEAGCCWDMEEPFAKATSAADGIVDLGELAAGEYMLVETAAPDGYQLPYGQWVVGCDAAARSISIAARGDPAPPAFKRDAGTGAYSLLNYRAMVLPLAGAGFTADTLTLAAAVLLTFVASTCAWRLPVRCSAAQPYGFRKGRRMNIGGYRRKSHKRIQ